MQKQANAVVSWLTTFFAKFAAPVVAEKPAGPVTRKFPKPSGYHKYTLAQVAEHNTPEDAWVVVDGEVYDVSAMKHPGVKTICRHCERFLLMSEMWTVANVDMWCSQARRSIAQELNFANAFSSVFQSDKYTVHVFGMQGVT